MIDSGAAYSTTPSADGLTNLQRLKKILNLEYADGSTGAQIDCEGTLSLNGHEVSALVSPDLKEDQKRKSTKLHGHGSDCIYLGPSENSSHRGGLFFSKATNEVSVRRSHDHWVDKPFFDFIVNNGNVSTTFEETVVVVVVVIINLL